MEFELEDLSSPLMERDSGPDFDQLALLPPTEKYTVEFLGQETFIDSSDWRTSRLLKWQIFTAFAVYILFGLAEQTVGTLIPKLQDHYHMDDVQTAYIFLASTFGYFSMALMSEQCNRTFGYKGVLMMGTMSMTGAYLAVSFVPPYAVFILAYVFSGIGFGSLDASLNAWMGSLVDANQLLGLLHGWYGVGCMISPPVITHLLEKKKNPWQWHTYYSVLMLVAVVCFILLAATFRNETAVKFRFEVLLKQRRRELEEAVNGNGERGEEPSGDARSKDGEEPEGAAATSDTSSHDRGKDFSHDRDKDPSSTTQESVASTNTSTPEPKASEDAALLAQSLRSPLVWFFSAIMFIYVGGEVSFGAWLVTFLVRIKTTRYQLASYMATTFWTGLTTGRMCLGFVTAHYFHSEIAANLSYIALSAVGHVAFAALALAAKTPVLFVVVFLTGLFVGPIFPTTIVAAIQVLPVRFHATGVGFICAFGGGGGAMVPFLIGLVADKSELGLRFYPYIVLLLYVVLMVAWLLLFARHRHRPRRVAL